MSRESQHIEGTIERITYQSEETGYTVAKLEPKLRHLKATTVVGHLVGIHPGEHVRLEGYWVTHPQYGRQFKIESYKVLYPSTIEGIRKYLGSGLIKGIGPVTASRIVKHFGLDTLDIIETHPDRLVEVPGTGKKRVEMITRAWEEQKSVKDVMLFLQSHDVSTTYAVKIYKQYGEDAIEVVRENPYRLERDIWGIGFVTADRIAQKVGMAGDSPERIKAGVRYVLNQYSEQGHLFVPREELLGKAVETLGVASSGVGVGIEGLVKEEGVVVESGSSQGEDRVYLPPLYYAEVGVANALRRLMRHRLGEETSGSDIDRELGSVERRMRIRFADAQRDAIRKAWEEKVVVITGGPGTQHYLLLQRNLLYTAVTRAKRMVVLVGTSKALWIAVKNAKVAQRYTSLSERLRG